MADADSALKILVQLGVIGQADVAAAKDLLAETGETGKKALDGMNQSMPENLEGWKNFKSGLDESHNSMEGVSEQLHGLGGAARSAGLGEIGHLLREALNPVGLTVGVIVGGMEAWFKWQERIEERNKQAIKDLSAMNDFYHNILAAGQTMEEIWVDQQKAIAEARAQISGLASDLKKVQDTSSIYDIAAKDALDRDIEGQTSKLNLLQEQAKLLEAMGKLSPEKADEIVLKAEHQKAIDAINANVTKTAADVSLAQTNRDQFVKTAGGPGAYSPDAIGAAQGKISGLQEMVDRATALADSKSLGEQIQKQQDIIGEQTTRAKNKPLEWNDAMDFINQAKDQIKTLKSEAATATAALPSMLQQLASAKDDLKTIQGLHDQVAGMDLNIRKLQQTATDASQASGQKIAEENSKFAIEYFQSILKNTGMSPEDIIKQGSTAMEELKIARNAGYDASRTTSEGNQAIANRNAGLPYDQGAINALDRFKMDQTFIERLQAAFNSLTNGHELLLSIATTAQARGASLEQRTAALENAYRTQAQNMVAQALTGLF